MADTFVNFGMNVVSPVAIRDGSLAVTTTSTIYAGTPLTIDTTSGKLRPATGTEKVFGLSHFQQNTSSDEVSGTGVLQGAYGSGLGDVVLAGIVDVYTAYFGTAGTTSYTAYDSTCVGATPMAPLYSNAGVITTTSGSGATSFGYVVVAPATLGDALRIKLG